MDAKPQRPRILRVNDENAAPTLITTGKSLHMRTKSTPALSVLHAAGAKAAFNQKRVLGEVSTNTQFLHKDDIEIGKNSPAKLSMLDSLKEQANAAPLARPAVRPLGPKSGFSQNTHAVVLAPTQGKASGAVKAVDSELGALKVIPKKSKILKDALSVAGFVHDTKKASVVECNEMPKTSKLDSQQSEVIKDTTGDTVSVSFAESQKIKNVSLTDVIGLAPIPERVVADFAPQQKKKQMAHTHQKALVNTFLQDDGLVAYNVLSTTQNLSDLDLDDDDGSATGRSLGQPCETINGLTLLFAPQYTEKVKAEIAAAKDFVDSTRTDDEIEDELYDTSMVAEYSEDIFEHMRDLETRMLPNAHYMDYQHEIQWNMRSVLLDWVVQVHHRFTLLPETLFLAVNYIDRFLSVKVVSTAKLQLVGATALFLAAKYEEVNPPNLADILFMGDGAYTSDELLRAERFMLNMLRFELGWPGPLSFLRRISKADDYDLETRTLAKYFLEVTVMDERFVGCTPSFLAAGAHCLARLMLRKGDWTQAHVYYSNYTMSQLRRIVVAMYQACKEPIIHHNFVFQKYSDKRYKRASLFVRSEMDRGFKLSIEFRDSTERLPTQCNGLAIADTCHYPKPLPASVSQQLLSSLAF